MSDTPPPHDFEIRLSDALQWPTAKVVDVYGYLTNEFGDIAFKVSRIVLDNGKTLYVEGEHDLPYIMEGLRDDLTMPEDT